MFKLKAWIKTTRVQTAMVTAMALWIGYVSVAPLSSTFKDFLFLAVLGLIIHIAAFTFNEVEDYKFDLQFGETKGHPIAKGEVDHSKARTISWILAVAAVIFCMLITRSIIATSVLVASFIPGYMYDKLSKMHWWSNLYLSVWAILMVFTGALVAGVPTLYTLILSAALGIQIFVQVIQGDLKDFNTPEASLSKRLGVKLTHENDLDYTKVFTSIVYGLKIIELGLIVTLAVITFSYNGLIDIVWSFSIILLSLAFIYTSSSFIVNVFDRSRIKKASSIHELVSILLLAVSTFQLDSVGAILIAIIPVMWYLLINSMLHSSSLNPDI